MTDYVLGLDPGFAKLGYALVAVSQGRKLEVVAMGTLVTEKREAKNTASDNVRRGIELAHWLESLVAGVDPRAPAKAPGRGLGVAALFGARPTLRAICAESMSHPRSASAAAKVSIVWGLIIANAVRRRAPLIQQSPQAVKIALVGTSDASKTHIERAMVRRYGAKIRKLLTTQVRGLHEHAYDALATASSCLDSAEGKAALKGLA